MPQNTTEKVIDIPGVGSVAFPSTMTDAQVDASAAKLYREANPDTQVKKPGSWIRTASDWLPTAGAAIGGTIGAIGGTAFGMGFGGIPGSVGGAALGGAAGEAANQLVDRVMGDESAPTSAGQATARMGTRAAIEGGTSAIGGAVVPVAKRVAGALMQSAVKPGIRQTARAVARGVSPEDLPVVKTLLNEGVNVSPGGIKKLNRIITATNDDIKAAIQSLPGTVDPAAVATRTQSLGRQVATQVNPADDVRAVTGAVDEFLTQPATTMAAQTGTKQVPTGILNAQGQMTMTTQPVMGRVSRPLSLPEAQDLKTGTYKALSQKAYGELKAPAVEAQKALARGLKEEIEAEAKKAGVNLGAMNAREGGAIAAKEAVAQRVAAAGNRDPVALAWLAANPTAGLLFIMERSPAVKSMLARGLYQSASKAGHVPEHVLRLLVGAIAASGDDMTEEP